MNEIRSARPAEYDTIMSFLENAYGHTLNLWSRRFPQSSRPENFDFQRTYLLLEQGRLACLAKYYPLEMTLGGVGVKVGGIGAVSTDPALRGRGFMSRLLAHAFGEMTRDGCVISALEGDRLRYRPFGYECAGKTLVLEVNARSCRKAGVEPLVPRRFLGEEGTLDQVARVHERGAWRCRRAPGDYRLIFHREGVLLFTAGEGEHFGYLALAGEQGRGGTLEFGGCPETVLATAAYCIGRFEIPRLAFFFAGRHEIPSACLEAADDWFVRPAWKLKILDLDGTLRAFSAQARGKPAPDPARLRELSGPGQVDALFGTLSDDVPFNFFIWPLDCI